MKFRIKKNLSLFIAIIGSGVAFIAMTEASSPLAILAGCCGLFLLALVYLSENLVITIERRAPKREVVEPTADEERIERIKERSKKEVRDVLQGRTNG